MEWYNKLTPKLYKSTFKYLTHLYQSLMYVYYNKWMTRQTTRATAHLCLRRCIHTWQSCFVHLLWSSSLLFPKIHTILHSTRKLSKESNILGIILYIIIYLYNQIKSLNHFQLYTNKSFCELLTCKKTHIILCSFNFSCLTTLQKVHLKKNFFSRTGIHTFLYINTAINNLHVQQCHMKLLEPLLPV